VKTASNFASGFLLGALLGATLAILFAPSTGEELRNKIQGEVQRVQSEVTKASEDKRAELEQQLSAMRAPRRPTQV
jgi:gas vesicle protein